MKQFVPHFTDQHINDQSALRSLPGGESLVDYIGATATIEEDWKRIVGAINERAATTFVPGAVTNPNGHGGASGHGVETECQCAAPVCVCCSMLRAAIAASASRNEHR